MHGAMVAVRGSLPAAKGPRNPPGSALGVRRLRMAGKGALS